MFASNFVALSKACSTTNSSYGFIIHLIELVSMNVFSLLGDFCLRMDLFTQKISYRGTPIEIKLSNNILKMMV